MLGEPERQWDVEDALLAGVADEVRAAEALADHLREPPSGLSGELLPHEEEVGVEGVDGRPTDDDARRTDQQLADRVRIVGVDAAKFRANLSGAVNGVVAAAQRRAALVLVAHPARLGASQHLLLCDGVARSVPVFQILLIDGAVGGLARLAVVHGRELCRRGEAGAVLRVAIACRDARQLDDRVEVVDEVAVPVERHLALGSEGNRGAKRLADRLHRERRVLVVPDLEVGEGGIRREVLVEGTDRDELREGAVSGTAVGEGRHRLRGEFPLRHRKKVLVGRRFNVVTRERCASRSNSR